MSSPIITIDGPSGVGKGTLSKLLSKKLRWNMLDSGMIYRMLAMEILAQDIIVDSNHKAIIIKVATMFSTVYRNQFGNSDFLERFENHTMYSEDVASVASKLAEFPEIRSILLQCQRIFHRFPGLVANGRDMGTVVFPHASLKIFLHASSTVRCERRLHQLRSGGVNIDFDSLSTILKERDNRDCTRLVAPLVPASGSLIFNSTYLALNELFHLVLKCFYNYCVIW